MPLVSLGTTLDQGLKKDGVIPDVLDEFSSLAVITASYGKKEVSFGNELAVDETQELPTVNLTFSEVAKSGTYTLVITDPDAPKRGDPKWSEYAHFLVTDIKPGVQAGESYTIDFSKAKTVLSYLGPGPPPKTGLHRYVFVLYEQDGSVKGLPSDERANWGTNNPGSGVRDWAKGQPLKVAAANFFLAKNAEQ